MTSGYSMELLFPKDFSGLAGAEVRTTGTADDDDDLGDEHADDNEARVGTADERTELPEEFSTDDGAGHLTDPRVDDAGARRRDEGDR